MKKINNYYGVMLASYSFFTCAMDSNGHPMVYNPKIYIPRDAAGNPLMECANYQIQTEVVKQQDIVHAESNNLLMAASYKALEAHEKKAKL